MPFLTELDVVNGCLGTMGEAPLASLDDEHPLRASAQQSLRVANMREQAKGWWFNKELTTLTPDPVTKYITLPGDTVRVDPTDESLNYVQRGDRLYQPYAKSAADKYQFDRKVDCYLVRLVPFVDLPPMAQNLVEAAAILDFQMAYDADRKDTEDRKAEYREALIALNTEHIRNVNANRLRNPSFLRKMGAIAPYRNIYNPYC